MYCQSVTYLVISACPGNDAHQAVEGLVHAATSLGLRLHMQDAQLLGQLHAYPCAHSSLLSEVCLVANQNLWSYRSKYGPCKLVIVNTGLLFYWK